MQICPSFVKPLPSECVNLRITRKRQSSERLYRLMDEDLKIVSSATVVLAF